MKKLHKSKSRHNTSKINKISKFIPDNKKEVDACSEPVNSDIGVNAYHPKEVVAENTISQIQFYDWPVDKSMSVESAGNNSKMLELWKQSQSNVTVKYNPTTEQLPIDSPHLVRSSSSESGKDSA